MPSSFSKLVDATMKADSFEAVAGGPTEDRLDEVSPPGFKGTVKAMKKRHSDEIDNPYALAWWMKDKGYTSHKKATGGPKNEQQGIPGLDAWLTTDPREAEQAEVEKAVEYLMDNPAGNEALLGRVAEIMGGDANNWKQLVAADETAFADSLYDFINDSPWEELANYSQYFASMGEDEWGADPEPPNLGDPDYESHLPRRKAEFRDGAYESREIRVWHPLHGKGTIMEITESFIEVEWDNLVKRIEAPRTIEFKDAKYLERISEGYTDDPDEVRVGKDKKRKEKEMKKAADEDNKVDEGTVVDTHEETETLTWGDLAFDFVTEQEDDVDYTGNREQGDSDQSRKRDAEDTRTYQGSDYVNVPRPADSVLTNQEEQPSYTADPLSTHDGHDAAHNEQSPDGDYGSDLVPNDAPNTPDYREMDTEGRKNTKNVGDSDEFTQRANSETNDSGEKPEKNKSSEEESKMKANESLPELTAEDLGLVVITEGAVAEACPSDYDMNEHDMGSGEIAFSRELLDKLLSAVSQQTPDEGKLMYICQGLEAAQQEKGDVALDVSDMEMIMGKMKDAASGEGNGEAEAGMEYSDDNGENNDYDYDEDRAAADGQIAGPEGGDEHEGKTMMMDRRGMSEKKGRDLDKDGDVDSDDWKKARDRKIKASMKRDKPKKSQQYEAKGGSSGTPVGQEVGGGPGGGSKTDLSKAKDWKGKALGDETGGGPGGGNKTEFGQKPSEEGGSNLLPANDRGSSLGAHDTAIKSKDASLNPQNKKPLAAEGRKGGPGEAKKRLDENIMLGLSAIPGTYLGSNSGDMSQFEIDPDDPDADIKEMRRRSGIEEWWKV